MSRAQDLFAAGKLNEAIDAVGAELRDRPMDVAKRTFLFELLCFAGNWDRADKQLDWVAGEGQGQRMGALQYRGAINAERTRQDRFETNLVPAVSKAPAGTWNGQPFATLADADRRVAGALEVIAGDNYMWIPWEHISSVTMEAPKRLRDLLWAPAVVQTGPSFRGLNLGPVLLPVLSPFSWRHADPQVRLGRVSVWESQDSGEEVPFGQKLWLVDGEEVPLLDLRSLEFSAPEE